VSATVKDTTENNGKVGGGNNVDGKVTEVRVVNKELPAAMQYRNMKLAPPKVCLFLVFLIIFILFF